MRRLSLILQVCAIGYLSMLLAPPYSAAWVRVETCDAACQAEPVEGETGEEAPLCTTECEGDIEEWPEAPCNAACEAAEPPLPVGEEEEPASAPAVGHAP